MKSIATFSDLLIRVFLAIAMVALFIMMLVTVADVFMRYVFNSPITGSYDVVEISLVIAVFYSIGAVIYGFHEIVIDIVDQLVSAKVAVSLGRLAATLSAAVLIFIFIAMIKPAMQSWQYNEMRMELNLPVWIVWAIALTGMTGGILASVLKMLGHDRRKRLPAVSTGDVP